MKSISKKAAQKLTRILEYEGIATVGDHTKVQTNDTYMPLSIEAIGDWENTREAPCPPEMEALEISLCHYGLQNGDMMADPEVILLRVKMGAEYVYYPASFKQDFTAYYMDYAHNWGVAQGREVTPRARDQADLCQFMGTWIDNIIHQQYEGKAPRKGTTRAKEEAIEEKVAAIKAGQKKALEEIIAPLETIEGQKKAETKEERKARLEEARIEREEREKETAKRREAIVEPPTHAMTNARGIEKSEEARRQSHIAAQKKYEKAQEAAMNTKESLPKNKGKGVIFTTAPAWLMA